MCRGAGLAWSHLAHSCCEDSASAQELGLWSRQLRDVLIQHVCTGADSQSVTCELTFTSGTGDWGLFPLVDRESLHFGNCLNDCSGL